MVAVDVATTKEVHVVKDVDRTTLEPSRHQRVVFAPHSAATSSTMVIRQQPTR